MEGVKTLYEKAATEMGVNKLFNWGDFKEVAKTDEFKTAYKDIFTEQMTAAAAGDGNMFATDEAFLTDVLNRTLEGSVKSKETKAFKKAVEEAALGVRTDFSTVPETGGVIY